MYPNVLLSNFLYVFCSSVCTKMQRVCTLSQRMFMANFWKFDNSALCPLEGSPYSFEFRSNRLSECRTTVATEGRSQTWFNSRQALSFHPGKDPGCQSLFPGSNFIVPSGSFVICCLYGQGSHGKASPPESETYSFTVRDHYKSSTCGDFIRNAQEK